MGSGDHVAKPSPSPHDVAYLFSFQSTWTFISSFFVYTGPDTYIIVEEVWDFVVDFRAVVEPWT